MPTFNKSEAAAVPGVSDINLLAWLATCVSVFAFLFYYRMGEVLLYGDAIAHINEHGSHHTDGILASDSRAIDKFVASIDTASVMVNASTRFADGGEFGLGAEIGISTDKLHARGPMGAMDLTTYKWIIRGNGHIR